MSVFSHGLEILRGVQPLRMCGTVAALRGLTLLVDAMPAPVGSLVRFGTGRASEMGEVIGFEAGQAIVMPLGSFAGVRAGDPVVCEQTSPTVLVGERLLGRVINGLGEPIDGGGPIAETRPALLQPAPITPMQRRRIREAIPTGVRAIDAMLTLGKGQRIGLFAGPGVGKSTLLGQIARRSEADINVVALIGERGREVREFIEEALGEEGLARSVVVVATSDELPPMRVRAMFVACAVAECFRDNGADVMLMMDSVTRFAHAQRQIGLAAGEPPATKGYTPSVFAMLPQLLERAGAVEGAGSITGVYTVLVEGDDMTEPIADAARGVLDGHVILSRDLARKGHYPAIDLLDSVSRVAESVVDASHTAARRQVISLLAALREVEDLVQVGAYAQGSNPTADVAMALKPKLEALLLQTTGDAEPMEQTRLQLLSIALEAGEALQHVNARRGGA